MLQILKRLEIETIIAILTVICSGSVIVYKVQAQAGVDELQDKRFEEHVRDSNKRDDKILEMHGAIMEIRGMLKSHFKED